MYIESYSIYFSVAGFFHSIDGAVVGGGKERNVLPQQEGVFYHLQCLNDSTW